MIPGLALDTNAYRALDSGDPKLGGFVRTVPQVGVPITVLGELYYGIFLGGKQEESLSNLSRFLALLRVELLHIDEITAKLLGEITAQLRQKGRPIQQDDMWIAALCKQYGYTLATADEGFDAITGLELFRF